MKQTSKENLAEVGFEMILDNLTRNSYLKMLIVDKLGRRPLLLIPFSIGAFSLLLSV